MTDANYVDLALLTNTLAQAKSILHSLEQAVSLYMNTNKTEITCFKQDVISTLSGKPLKLVDKFTYLSSNILSTENYINIHQVKAMNAIDRLLIIWKSDPSNKIKQDFFQVVTASTLLLIKLREKKLNGNYTRMLCAILNKSWKQHPTKQQFYSHLPPITQIIQIK